MLNLFLIAIISYLIGSIPTGYIIVKIKKNIDIREVGSGSTGATNVKRILGKKWFFIVMLLDALKGAIPVIISRYIPVTYDNFGQGEIIAAIMVIFGHSKPVFLKFKGGKSVASGVGTIYALSPVVGLIITLFWSMIAYISKYVSLASIIALLISPFLMYIFHKPLLYIVYCAFGAVYITYLHRENIIRLLKGEENKVR